jgi:hypothetical protein
MRARRSGGSCAIFSFKVVATISFQLGLNSTFNGSL